MHVICPTNLLFPTTDPADNPRVGVQINGVIIASHQVVPSCFDVRDFHGIANGLNVS